MRVLGITIRSRVFTDVPNVMLTSSTCKQGDGGPCHLYTCVATNVTSVEWWIDDTEVAFYTPSIYDTIPKRLLSQSKITQAEVIIEAVKPITSLGVYTIHSTMKFAENELSPETVKCGSKRVYDTITSDSGLRWLNYSSTPADPSVNLTSDITLQGDICPISVQFNCSIQDLPYVIWFLGDEDLVKFSPEKQNYPYNLCEHLYEDHQILKEICSYHGKLVIVNVTESDTGKDRYNIFSTFELRTYFINDGKGREYDTVSCGSNEHKGTVPTNFTVSCNNPSLDPTVKLTAKPNASHPCPSVGTELTCVGNDLQSLTWSYNLHHNITEPYVYNFITDQFPLKLHSSLSGVRVTINSADMKNDYFNHFGFVSILNFTESYNNITSVTCGSSKETKKVDLNCKCITQDKNV